MSRNLLLLFLLGFIAAVFAAPAVEEEEPRPVPQEDEQPEEQGKEEELIPQDKPDPQEDEKPEEQGPEEEPILQDKPGPQEDEKPEEQEDEEDNTGLAEKDDEIANEDESAPEKRGLYRRHCTRRCHRGRCYIAYCHCYYRRCLRWRNYYGRRCVWRYRYVTRRHRHCYWIWIRRGRYRRRYRRCRWIPYRRRIRYRHCYRHRRRRCIRWHRWTRVCYRHVSPVIRTYRLCEHRSGILRCPRGRRLVILYANYGRTTGRRICPSRYMRTTRCRSSFSNRLIRCACHNRNSCPLFAKNQVFGDPCVGTFKYIEVRYKCV